MLTTFLIPCIFIKDLYNKRRYMHLKKRYSISFHATTPIHVRILICPYVMPADKKKNQNPSSNIYTCEYNNSKIMQDYK